MLCWPEGVEHSGVARESLAAKSSQERRASADAQSTIARGEYPVRGTASSSRQRSVTDSRQAALVPCTLRRSQPSKQRPWRSHSVAARPPHASSAARPPSRAAAASDRSAGTAAPSRGCFPREHAGAQLAQQRSTSNCRAPRPRAGAARARCPKSGASTTFATPRASPVSPVFGRAATHANHRCNGRSTGPAPRRPAPRRRRHPAGRPPAVTYAFASSTNRRITHPSLSTSATHGLTSAPPLPFIQRR